jgi:hypothetical protein
MLTGSSGHRNGNSSMTLRRRSSVELNKFETLLCPSHEAADYTAAEFIRSLEAETRCLLSTLSVAC